MDRIESWGNTITNLTMYDIKSMYNQVRPRARDLPRALPPPRPPRPLLLCVSPLPSPRLVFVPCFVFRSSIASFDASPSVIADDDGRPLCGDL